MTEAVVKIYVISGLGQLIAEEKEGVMYNPFLVKEVPNRQQNAIDTIFAPFIVGMVKDQKVHFKDFAVLADTEAGADLIKMYNQTKGQYFNEANILVVNNIKDFRKP